MKKLFLFALIFCSHFGFSQVLNIEKFRPQSDTSKALIGNIEFGFDGKRQRISTYSYNTDVNIAYLSKHHSYLILSTLSFNQVENTEVTNQGYAHYRMNFWRKTFISLEQFNQIQFDAGRGLNERRLIGTAAKVNFIRSDNLNLSFSMGGMYEVEEWFDEEENSKPINNSFFKISQNIMIRYKITKNTTFFLINYYQARPQSIFEPRISLDSYLKVGINKKLAIGLQYDMTYDTQPPIEIARLVYSFKTNLVYKF